MAVIVAGELYVYSENAAESYNMEATITENGANISITSGISNVYDMMIIDNGSMKSVSQYLVYYDSSYGERLDDTWHATGGRVLDQEYYVTQLLLQLENRGVDATKVDARELKDAMTSEKKETQAVVIVSGALPDTVYTGNTTDIIIKWLNNGGRLYWAGNVLGKYISTPENGVVEAPEDSISLFFNTDCQNKNETYGTIPSNNEYRRMLCLNENGTKYGLDHSVIKDSLAIGYTDGKYSSICLTKYGNGMICVFGGILSNEQRADIAQVIASGLTYCSKVVAFEHGTVTRDTVSIHANIEKLHGNLSVFVSLGGYYPVYGNKIDLFDQDLLFL